MTPIKIWPGLAPGETTSLPGRVLDDQGGNVTRVTDVTGAEMTMYGADSQQKRPCVLVCPGGGYEILATDLEGTEIAQWLASLGYVAPVLHYRVPNNRLGALQDGQRALSLLRSCADDFGIDANRVGVMGFSAGGHLAIRMAVAGTERAYDRVDELDDHTCRPDFALGIYPAFLNDSVTNAPMPDVMPRPGMPSLFLAQSRDDDHFCVEAYSTALDRVGVSVQSVAYASGGHGYGVRLPADVPAARWQADAAEWLQARCS
jgi:acetyl esterase/lipase